MTGTVIFELEQNRKRLDFYNTLKNKTASTIRSKKLSPTDKWVEIYAERVQKLERRLKRLKAAEAARAAAAAEAAANPIAVVTPGLRVQLKKSAAKKKKRA